MEFFCAKLDFSSSWGVVKYIDRVIFGRYVDDTWMIQIISPTDHPDESPTYYPDITNQIQYSSSQIHPIIITPSTIICTQDCLSGTSIHSKNQEFTEIGSNENSKIIEILKNCIYQNSCIKFLTHSFF